MGELVPYGQPPFERMADALLKFNHPIFWPTDTNDQLRLYQSFLESLDWNFMLHWFICRHLLSSGDEEGNFEVDPIVLDMRRVDVSELEQVSLEYKSV
jgi:hypothetical protein